SAEAAANGAAQTAERAPESSNVAQGGDGESREGRPHEQLRRRRRPRPPRPAEASGAEADKLVAGSVPEGTQAGAPRPRSAPYRGWQSRGARDRRRGDEQPPPERGPTGHSRGSSDRPARGRGTPGRNDRRQGRDRDAPSKRPEPRLYALESVVDRGFEDVI